MRETPGSIPGSGRAPWRRKWQPTPVFLPGKSHGQTEQPGVLQSMGLQRVGHDWATSLSLWRWFHLFFIILQYLVFFFFCMRPTCFHAHRWINTFIWHQDPHFIYSQSKFYGSCWGQQHDTSPTWKQALLTQRERSLHNLTADAGKGLLSDFQTLNNRI